MYVFDKANVVKYQE